MFELHMSPFWPTFDHPSPISLAMISRLFIVHKYTLMYILFRQWRCLACVSQSCTWLLAIRQA
jgi:hypothetical protein